MTNQFAVIDIGSSSIRLAIAQSKSEGGFSVIESLQKPIALGKNTFVQGSINKSNIEECVQILKGFCKVLGEYHVPQESIRVVATSAVREASNKEALIDRVYIATGLQIYPIDEAEITRLTYLALRQTLARGKNLLGENADIVVTEIGGGSTELLHLIGGKVSFAQTFPIGSIKLFEMVEDVKSSTTKIRNLLEKNIGRTITQIKQSVDFKETTQLMIMGGDARFAARNIIEDWNPENIAKTQISSLSKLVDEIFTLNVDEIVKRYRISYTEAETVGPALLFYLCLARAAKSKQIMAAACTMRDGMLIEFAEGGAWSPELTEQIVNSALEIGKKYEFDEAHARHVAELSSKIFLALSNEHRLDSRHGFLLYLAGILHEIGNFVSNRSHHKHSMYLISSSEIFGLGRRDHLLVGIIARYHRRASPKISHEGYILLNRDERILVSKLAAILRVADALDRSHSQRIQEIKCIVDDNKFVIYVNDIDDIALEQLGLKQKANMFEDVYGLNVLLRKAPTVKS